MGSDGVEPPESEDSRFTVCPATIYGITTQKYKYAEHLIGTLTPCETSIVYLLAEFEPLTIATILFLTTPMKRV